MKTAEYEQFNVWYWEREEDGSYTHKLDVYKTWQEASEGAFALIKDLDAFDPAGPKCRLEKIDPIYH